MRKLIAIKVCNLLTVFMILGCSQQVNFVLETEAKYLEDLSNVTILDSNISEDIEVNTSFIKTKWEGLMTEELGMPVNLVSFRIIKTNHTDDQAEKYFLMATSEGGTIETGAFLEKISENVYRLGVKECTCKGCPNGCNLEVDGDNCSCSDCNKNSNKECTKTERVIING